jgi:hypothetical protein
MSAMLRLHCHQMRVAPRKNAHVHCDLIDWDMVAFQNSSSLKLPVALIHQNVATDAAWRPGHACESARWRAPHCRPNDEQQTPRDTRSHAPNWVAMELAAAGFAELPALKQNQTLH